MGVIGNLFGGKKKDNYLKDLYMGQQSLADKEAAAAAEARKKFIAIGRTGRKSLITTGTGITDEASTAGKALKTVMGGYA